MLQYYLLHSQLLLENITFFSEGHQKQGIEGYKTPSLVHHRSQRVTSWEEERALFFLYIESILSHHQATHESLHTCNFFRLGDKSACSKIIPGSFISKFSNQSSSTMYIKMIFFEKKFLVLVARQLFPLNPTLWYSDVGRTNKLIYTYTQKKFQQFFFQKKHVSLFLYSALLSGSMYIYRKPCLSTYLTPNIQHF